MCKCRLLQSYSSQKHMVLSLFLEFLVSFLCRVNLEIVCYKIGKKYVFWHKEWPFLHDPVSGQKKSQINNFKKGTQLLRAVRIFKASSKSPVHLVYQDTYAGYDLELRPSASVSYFKGV